MAEDHSNYRFDLQHIQKRVRQKLKDHERYDFSPLQNNLLKSFFDLVQEYTQLDDFYRIAVVVLLEAMQVESALYLLNDEEKKLKVVCTSQEGIIREQRPIPTGIYLSDQPYKKEMPMWCLYIVKHQKFLKRETACWTRTRSHGREIYGFSAC